MNVFIIVGRIRAQFTVLQILKILLDVWKLYCSCNIKNLFNFFGNNFLEFFSSYVSSISWYIYTNCQQSLLFIMHLVSPHFPCVLLQLFIWKWIVVVCLCDEFMALYLDWLWGRKNMVYFTKSHFFFQFEPLINLCH